MGLSRALQNCNINWGENSCRTVFVEGFVFTLRLWDFTWRKELFDGIQRWGKKKYQKKNPKPFEGSIIFLSWLHEVCWDIQSRLLKDFVDVWKRTLNFP